MSKKRSKRKPIAAVRRVGRRTPPKTSGEPNRDRAIDLVMRMMPIAGPSGGEAAVARFITQKLRQAGASSKAIASDQAHRRTPVRGDCGNLVLRLPGTMRGPRRLFSAHLDTVPICVGCKPVRKGNLVRSADPRTGLGGDDRAGAAVVLSTALEVLGGKLAHPPLTFLWTVQEEVGLQGARNLRLGMLGRPRLGFNFDGGGPGKLTIGATGGYRMEIEIRGLASHAGNAPEEGVSAIAIASLAVADLHEGGWHGDISKRGRHGTSNVGTIQGGAATNVVADHLTLKAEARSHDPKFRREILRQIESAFRRAATKVKNAAGKRGKVRITSQLDYESFKLPIGSPAVKAAQAAVQATGLTPELAVCNGGLDANWLCVHGIPTVSLGCGQKFIHTAKEQLDLAKYYQACRIALRLAGG